MLISTHNRNVQQTFLGTPDDDISTALGGMKIACLMTPDDTVDMTILRMGLFYWVFQASLPTPVYGIPVEDYQRDVSFRPQVHLFFWEDWNEQMAVNRLPPIRSQISFRLIHESSATMTPDKAQTLAVRIREVFGTGQGFTWERGPLKVVYRDLANGYIFQLLVISEAEAVRLIEAVLSIQGHSFNEQYLTITQSRKLFSSVPGVQEVYGKERRKPRQRPTVRVRFRRAELSIWGMSQSILLVGHYGNPKPLVTF